jgi:F-type H+-transporting ATPase subunit gamma
MPSVRQIKRRIRSVENTAKITKAMSMIAASKMRRAQETALQGRPYSSLMTQLLADLAAQPHDEENLHPLLQRREINNVQLVIITPDRGLTGGLNSNIIRASGQFLIGNRDRNTSVIAVGKKGRDFAARTRQDLKAVFIDMGDRPSITDITPITRLIIDGFTNQEVDAVHIVYARFVNTTVQRPVIEQLLPVVPPSEESPSAGEYIYEPNSMTVLSAMLPRFVEMQLYHAVLEGIASEQSARMVAMRNATDNANAMTDDLTLEMNKVRQEAITTELLDIVSGAAAVEA